MLCNNNNTIKEDLQVLKDVNEKGKVINWKDKKCKTQYIADSYFRIAEKLDSKHYEKKSLRVLSCGDNLEFRRYHHDNSLKLNKADFCKDRLCPMCNWRRSLKVYGQVSKTMYKLQEQGNYRFLFLTLTCRNVFDEDLEEQLNELFSAFDRFMKRRKLKKSVKGWFRALEITHNHDLDTYHPHFHVILVVEPQYFKKSDLYISQAEFTDYWKDSLNINYTPVVNIKAFKSATNKDMSKSIAETAKYTMKDSDLIVYDDNTYTDRIVLTIDNALYRRRLCAFGGVLKKIHSDLKLDDSVEGDLINVSCDDIRPELEFHIEKYGWCVGFNNYYRK